MEMEKALFKGTDFQIYNMNNYSLLYIIVCHTMQDGFILKGKNKYG